MADPGLFDPTPYIVPTPPPPPKLSADRRRTLRQATAIHNGVHPLALLFGAGIRMHPEADRGAQATDPRRLPLRCGTCWYRRPVAGHYDGTFPKCLYGQENHTDQTRHQQVPPRVTGSAASDVRAWWPACADYTPADPAVSDDAARYIPEESRD